MDSSLLKVFDFKHLILLTVTVPVLMNMSAEMTCSVGVVVGDRLAIL